MGEKKTPEGKVAQFSERGENVKIRLQGAVVSGGSLGPRPDAKGTKLEAGKTKTTPKE